MKSLEAEEQPGGRRKKEKRKREREREREGARKFFVKVGR